MGVLDGGGDRRRERGSFEGKCNQWRLCGVVVIRDGDAAPPKLLWDFLFITVFAQKLRRLQSEINVQQIT